jgi:hypothetical protein
MKGPVDRKEMLGKRDIIYASVRFDKMDDPGVGNVFYPFVSLMFNDSIKWNRWDRCTNRRCWLKCGNNDTNERYGVISDVLVFEADDIDDCNENPKI